METVNIQHIGENNSNPHIRGIELEARIHCQYFRPDGDGYEPMPDVVTTKKWNKDKMRLRGSRKQIAAKRMVPINVITIDKVGTTIDQVFKDVNLDAEVVRNKTCRNDTMERELRKALGNPTPVLAPVTKPPVAAVTIDKSPEDIKIEAMEEQLKRLKKMLGLEK